MGLRVVRVLLGFVQLLFGNMSMNVYLREPRESDAKECVEAALRSVELHHPWVYPATTLGSFISYVSRVHAPRHKGFLVCRCIDDRIVGVVNLNEIIRGTLDSAFVGYWGFVGFSGGGLMTEGVALVFDQAFQEIGLHRLEVNIQPGNTRSLALARRLGLRQEGLSKSFLQIGGEWRDHERFALCAEEWLEMGSSLGVMQRLRAANRGP